MSPPDGATSSTGVTMRITHLLTALVTPSVVLSCGTPREATVPVPPEEAVTRAAHVLESFDYNILELDRDEGVVMGTRSSGTEPNVLWRVTVHVTPVEGGAAARYRLESRATHVAEIPSQRGGTTQSDLPSIRLHRVPSTHLDEILADLAGGRP